MSFVYWRDYSVPIVLFMVASLSLSHAVIVRKRVPDLPEYNWGGQWGATQVISRCLEWGKRKGTWSCGRETRHRSPDLLGRVDFCRTDKTYSSRPLWELIKGKGLLIFPFFLLEGIGICSIQVRWKIEDWKSDTLIDLLSLPTLLMRGRNVISKLQLGASPFREAPVNPTTVPNHHIPLHGIL